MIQQDKASNIRQGEEIDVPKLQHFLEKEIKGFGHIVKIAQFPGGFSNLTYLLTTDEGVEYVLRRPPFGANIKSGHDMSREFRVLSLLEKANFKQIPTPLSIEPSGEVLGAPFYVMERLNGIILRAKDATTLDFSAEKMQLLSEKLIENLALLHTLDIEKTGLSTLGKPEGYVHRQVEGWIKRYKNSQTDAVKNMEFVAEWMLSFEPRPQKPAFLHNDYKFDNVVWNPEMSEIIGVLDWEMATVGDPLMDLGAALAYWCEPTDSEFSKMFNLTWLDGCFTREDVIAKYAALTGRDLTDIHFYYIFGLYKNAVIMQQIYARWKAGLTNDPRFGSLIKGVFELSKIAAKAIPRLNTEGGL